MDFPVGSLNNPGQNHRPLSGEDGEWMAKVKAGKNQKGIDFSLMGK